MYPNGKADVNHFTAAGGLPFVIRELLDAGLLHDDVDTVVGHGMRHYTKEPFLIDGKLEWREAPETSGNEDILRKADNPFSPDGGLRLMKGNIGRGVIKVSAVREGCRIIEHLPSCSTTNAKYWPHLSAASWNAILSASSAIKARAPTVCPSCTN